MQLTLSPTNAFVTIDGLHARRWEGVDQHGTRIIAFVAGVIPESTHTDAELGEMFAELAPMAEDPSPYDAKLFL